MDKSIATDLKTNKSRNAASACEHPYEAEVKGFSKTPVAAERVDLAAKYESGRPKGLDEATFHFVNSGEKFSAMLAQLEKEREIALDTENHDLFSYLGFLCLLQVSTRDADYVVDLTKVGAEEVQKINKITTDPAITKVLHSASNDVLWLQRDFSVYIVNLFDTNEAMRILNFEKTGLSTVLDNLLGVKTSKKFQTSDWSKRPLSLEMIDYARTDTRYLLFLKDHLHNQLAEKSLASGQAANFLETHRETCGRLCLATFEKPQPFEGDPLRALKYFRRLGLNAPSGLELFLFYRVFVWRDHKARAQNVSWAVVLGLRKMAMVLRKKPREAHDVEWEMGLRGGFRFEFAAELAAVVDGAIENYDAAKEEFTLFEEFSEKLKPLEKDDSVKAVDAEANLLSGFNADGPKDGDDVVFLGEKKAEKSEQKWENVTENAAAPVFLEYSEIEFVKQINNAAVVRNKQPNGAENKGKCAEKIKFVSLAEEKRQSQISKAENRDFLRKKQRSENKANCQQKSE